MKTFIKDMLSGPDGSTSSKRVNGTLLLLVFISLCYINTFCKSVDSQIFYYLIGLISFFFGSTSWEFMTYLKNNK